MYAGVLRYGSKNDFTGGDIRLYFDLSLPGIWGRST